MNVCLVAAGVASLVATSPDFTLSWTHSVERTEWQEDWTASAGGLRLLEARVRGSGAGMDPGEGARLVGGWWTWKPTLPAVPSLVLAASGETGGGWTLCEASEARRRCTTFGGAAAEPLVLRPCGDGEPATRSARRPGG